MFGSADLEEVGDGTPPWSQALGKSLSDWCLPSWCTWEVRGLSKASRVQGELADEQRTPVVAFEPNVDQYAPSALPQAFLSLDCRYTCSVQPHSYQAGTQWKTRTHSTAHPAAWPALHPCPCPPADRPPTQHVPTHPAPHSLIQPITTSV